MSTFLLYLEWNYLLYSTQLSQIWFLASILSRFLTPPPLHYWPPRTLSFSMFFKYISIFPWLEAFIFAFTRSSPNHLLFLLNSALMHLVRGSFLDLHILSTSSALSYSLPQYHTWMHLDSTYYSEISLFVFMFISSLSHFVKMWALWEQESCLFTSKSQWLQQNLVHIRR